MFWKRKRFKIGDSIITSHGERGIIVSEWDRDDKNFDWWIEITFQFQGEYFTSKLPVKNKEIRKDNG